MACAAVSPGKSGVRVAVRVTPGGSRDEVRGLTEDGAAIRVTVTAPPEGGKANTAVIKLLAKAWRVPKTSITVAAGMGSRTKSLLVAGDGAELARRIAEWIEGHAER